MKAAEMQRERAVANTIEMKLEVVPAAEALGGLSTQFKRAALSMLKEGRNAC
jgi:hypothetical protein